MKTIAWIGIVLIIVGGLAFAYQGFGYIRQNKVLEVGSVDANVEKPERLLIPPMLGGLTSVGGMVLLVFAAPKTFPSKSTAPSRLRVG